MWHGTHKMLVKCLNIENIDSISKKCVIQVCDFQCIYDVSVIAFSLNYYVKCESLLNFVATDVLSDLSEKKYISDVVCWRQDNDEIKC